MHGVTHRIHGVPRAREWEAHIWYDGRQLHVGAFDSEVHAATAADLARLLLHGNTAKLNFPASKYADLEPSLREEVFLSTSDFRERVRYLVEHFGREAALCDDGEVLVWTPSPRAESGAYIVKPVKV